MENKRGDKYYLIVALMLGLMVVALVLYFFFNEYFTQEEINLETCRQSVLLRSAIPAGDSRLADMTIGQFKSEFPLRCKTEVEEIDISPPDIDWGKEEDVYLNNYKTQSSKKIRDYEDEISKEITDRMLTCWHVLGAGNYVLFPRNIFEGKKSCVICYRIKFSEEIVDFFNKKKDIDSRSSFVDLRLGDYIKNHNFKGNFMLTSLPLDDNGNLDKDLIVPGQDSHLWPLLGWIPIRTLDQNNQMEFVFYDASTHGGFAQEYGVRPTINPTEGDLILGGYFYVRRGVSAFGAIPITSDYHMDYAFYAQYGVDGVSSCELQSVPA